MSAAYDLDGFPDDPTAPRKIDLDSFPDDPTLNAAVLNPDDFPDDPTTIKPAQSPAEVPETSFDRAWDRTKEAGEFGVDLVKQFGKTAVDMVTPSRRTELMNSELTGPATQAILSPLTMFTGAGDTPMMQQHKDNLARTGRTSADYENDVLFEKGVGGLSRVLATGGLAPIVEGAAKAVDIAQNEPQRELLGLGSAGRIGAAVAATYIPMKAGAAIERAVASKGLSGATSFIANALADAGVGTSAGKVQQAVEMIGQGVQPTSPEFWEAMKPNKMDAITAGPSMAAAGLGGLRANAGRRELMGDGSPVVTPAREAELQGYLDDEVGGLQSIGADRADARVQREQNTAARAEIIETENNIAATRDLVQSERIATEEVQAQQAVVEADRAFKDNPTLENAEARTEAVDRLQSLSPKPQVEPLLLTGPENRTAGDNSGVLVDTDPYAGHNKFDVEPTPPELPGEPVLPQSQDVAATPTTAGEAVINQAGQPVPNGRLGGRMTVAGRGQGASLPVQETTDFNPELGQLKTSTLEPETQQAVNDISYTDADTLQESRRGTVPVQQSIDAGGRLANKGAELVGRWKPGQAYNAEELVAVKAHTQGVTQRIAETQAEYDKNPSSQTRQTLYDLQEQQFSAVRAMVATKSEAGRALRVLRENIAPVVFDPVTGQPVKQPANEAGTITPDDKAGAVDYLTKLYGDKPVPASVQKEIADLAPDDIKGLANVLARQTRINNKSSTGDIIANTIKAGMLTSVRTIQRNVFGLEAKALKEYAGDQIGSFVDVLLSGATGNARTKAGLSPRRALEDKMRGIKEGYKDGLAMMKGDYTSEMARSEMDRFEFKRDQYSGESKFNKGLDLYVNTVFRSTAAVDMPVRKTMYYKSITDQAKLMALDEVQSGAIPKAELNNRIDELRLDPSDGMLAEAMIYSEQMVYADKNSPATGIKQLIDGLDTRLVKRGNVKASAGLKITAATTVPFLKTPLNITWDIFKTSLVDTMKTAGMTPVTIARVARGTLTPEQQKAFVQAAGNGGIGSAVMMAGAALYLNGDQTGSYENDATNMKQTNELANRDAGSIKVGDTWLRMQEIASPVSNLMVLGATMAREWEDPKGSVGLAAANTVLDNPFFKGVKDMAEIPDKGFDNFAASRAGAVVPAFVADAASMLDNTQRDARKQDGDSTLDVVGKKVASRLPGLRNMLPPKVDALGKTKEEQQRNIVMAWFPQEAKEDTNPMIGELVRLKVGMQKPERFYDKATGKQLETQDEYLARVSNAGDMIEKVVGDFVASESYKEMEDATRKAALEKMIKALPMNNSRLREGLKATQNLPR